jgi:hypothetical protein
MLWAELFAGVHVYWAAGGSWALPEGLRVEDHPALFVVDIVAVPLCIVGGLAAGSLVHPAGRRVPQRLRLAAVGTMSLICLAHSVPTVYAAVVALLQQRTGALSERAWISYYIYEPYWFLGGVLAGAATWTSRRRTRKRPT